MGIGGGGGTCSGSHKNILFSLEVCIWGSLFPQTPIPFSHSVTPGVPQNDTVNVTVVSSSPNVGTTSCNSAPQATTSAAAQWLEAL